MCRDNKTVFAARPRGLTGYRHSGSLALAYHEAWFRNAFLTGILIALVFLMFLSIYLASTNRGTPISPESETAAPGGTALAVIMPVFDQAASSSISFAEV